MTQTLVILGFAVLTFVGAQLSLKKGVLALGSLEFSFSKVLFVILQLFQNPWISIGLILYGISFLFWLFLLSRLQLNIIYPIASSLNIAIIAVISWALFKESLSPVQIVGVAVIIVGIFFLAPKG